VPGSFFVGVEASCGAFEPANQVAASHSAWPHSLPGRRIGLLGDARARSPRSRRGRGGTQRRKSGVAITINYRTGRSPSGKVVACIGRVRESQA
jgi:hypothetical protein